MKILLTGATGYIGSYLTEYLSENTSHEIIPLYRKLPKHFASWSDKFNGVECDVTKLVDLESRIPSQIDCVIHLAAFNDIDCNRIPDQALIVNGLGTRNMLEIAQKRGCPSFIYFSTLQVYGKELEGTITIDSPVNCSDDYALTHAIAEKYCEMFALRHNMNVNIIRPSNVFGCPLSLEIDRWSLVPGCFCLSAFEKNEIRLKSSGKQIRDFISLEFLSKSVKSLIEQERQGFNILNLTSEELFSIVDIASLVRSQAKLTLGKDIDLICKSEHTENNDISYTISDATAPQKKRAHCHAYN